ncbi:MAG: hypothetical protein K6B28_04795 [Lachnospiraceae bacterium]|nr:hypothetical protein [Lachnospiraceae bacterium]
MKNRIFKMLGIGLLTLTLSVNPLASVYAADEGAAATEEAAPEGEAPAEGEVPAEGEIPAEGEAPAEGDMAAPAVASTGVEMATIPTPNAEVLVSSVFADDLMPASFHKETTTYQGVACECAKFDLADLTLLYTTDSAGANGGFKIYDGISPDLADYRSIDGGNGKYIIILKAAEDVIIPEGYTKATLQWNGSNLEAYMRSDNINADGTATSGGAADFFLLYALSSDGNKGWYQYDQTEGTYQRFITTAADTGGIKIGGDDSSELGLTDLPIWVYIVVGALFLLMLIFLIIMIVSLVKLKEYQGYEYIDEDEYYAGKEVEDVKDTEKTVHKKQASSAGNTGKITASQLARESMDDDVNERKPLPVTSAADEEKTLKKKEKGLKKKKNSEDPSSFDWAAMESAMKDTSDERRPRGNEKNKYSEKYATARPETDGEEEDDEALLKPNRIKKPESEEKRAPLQVKPQNVQSDEAYEDEDEDVKIRQKKPVKSSTDEISTQEIEFALAQEREATIAKEREESAAKERELASARQQEAKRAREKAIEEARRQEEISRRQAEEARERETQRQRSEEEGLKQKALEEQERKIKELERKRDEILRQQEERKRQREREAASYNGYGDPGYDTGALFSNPTAYQQDPYSGQYVQDQYTDPGSQYTNPMNGQYQGMGSDYGMGQYPGQGYGNGGYQSYGYSGQENRYNNMSGSGYDYNSGYSDNRQQSGYQQNQGYLGGLSQSSEPVSPDTVNLEMDDDFEFEFLDTDD